MKGKTLARVWLTKRFIRVVEDIVEVSGNLLAQRLRRKWGEIVTQGGGEGGEFARTEADLAPPRHATVREIPSTMRHLTRRALGYTQAPNRRSILRAVTRK